MELMFFEKNKFFQRVGWCSGRNDFYRNSEGVSRNLLQEFAKLVAGICGTCCKIRQNLYQDSGPSDRKKRGFLKPDFCFLEVYVQIVGTDARFSGWNIRKRAETIKRPNPSVGTPVSKGFAEWLQHLKDFSARTYGALLPGAWTVVRADKYVKVHSIGNIWNDNPQSYHKIFVYRMGWRMEHGFFYFTCHWVCKYKFKF